MATPAADRRIEALERSSIGAGVTESLKQMIADRVFAPGERLPSQRALSESLQVSLPTVREAIRSLTDLGLLEVRHGSGTYVTSLDVADLLRPIEFALSLSGQQMAELFDLRLALEPAIARAAARRRTAEQVAAMRECIVLSREEGISDPRLLELDLQVHQLLVEATHNSLLAQIARMISSLGLASRRETVSLPGVEPETIRDHERIVEAIAARDEVAAEAATRDHLLRIQRLAVEAGLPAAMDEC